MNSPERQAEYMREYWRSRPEYREATKKRNRLHYSRRREVVNELKSRPCADCGVQYPPFVMQFDHLGDKEFQISGSNISVSLERLLVEVKKCDVVCSNCHAIRTYERSH